jgi:hypothetical protein
LLNIPVFHLHNGCESKSLRDDSESISKNDGSDAYPDACEMMNITTYKDHLHTATYSDSGNEDYPFPKIITLFQAYWTGPCKGLKPKITKPINCLLLLLQPDKPHFTYA